MDVERTIKAAGFDSETEAELLGVSRRVVADLERSAREIIADVMGGAPHIVGTWGIAMVSPDLAAVTGRAYEPGTVLGFEAVNAEGVVVSGVIPVELVGEPEPPAWSVAVG